MPYHVKLDTAGEAKLGKLSIGTTRRGIGPCYADKAARLGIRVQDLLDEKILRKKIAAAMEPKRLQLRPYAKSPELDHGTYPFVTSSNVVAGSACAGAGVGPKDIDEVWGVATAYATRVGSGPFPTELDDDLGNAMREAGGEYGTTTGRPRRVGWIDLVALRFAARINGLDHLAITKLDVLTGLGALNVCTRYRGIEEASFDAYPYHQTVMHHAGGDYERLPGWDEDIGECRDERDLPQAARDYLAYIADFVGVPIGLVGVGPGREQIIWTEAGRASA